MGVVFYLGVSDFADNAYPILANRTDGGTFVQTSPASRLQYLTDAETLYLETYNDIYTTYPDVSDLGIRVNGVDKIAVEPGAVGTIHKTIDLGVGLKTVDIINGLQSKPSARIGSYACSLAFNKAAAKQNPASTPRILLYGDSIHVGGNADNPSLEGVAQLVRNAYSGSLLLEAWGYRSLYDDCVDEAARIAFVSHIANQSPSIIWLGIGTNDYGLSKWTAANFGTAYADLLDKLHVALPSAAIYAQTPVVRATETANAVGSTMAEYRTQISTAQSTRSEYCTLVDGTEILTTDDLADGVHPTTAGHAKYAAYVKTVLGLT